MLAHFGLSFQHRYVRLPMQQAAPQARAFSWYPQNVTPRGWPLERRVYKLAVSQPDCLFGIGVSLLEVNSYPLLVCHLCFCQLLDCYTLV